MQIRTDKLYDTINGLPKIQKDDIFNFSCVQCGKCCKFYVNVLLTPLDIFKAAEYLSQTPQDFVEKYCEIRQDIQSKLPYVKFTAAESDSQTCHFYDGEKCAIHKAKPASCALYPAGRIFSHEIGGLSYFLQNKECETGKQSQQNATTIADWLEICGISDDEQFTVKWHKWLRGTAYKIRDIMGENTAYPSDVKSTLYSYLCVMLYLKYEISGDFMPQFTKNLEETDNIIELILAEQIKINI